MFDKIESIKVSERVFDLVKSKLELAVVESKFPIAGWLETFNNCREQGYMLVVGDDYATTKEKYMPSLYIWVAECRNSDNIIVYIDNERDGVNNKITQKAYNNAKCFKYDEYVAASDYIFNAIIDAYYKYARNI